MTDGVFTQLDSSGGGGSLIRWNMESVRRFGVDVRGVQKATSQATSAILADASWQDPLTCLSVSR
jgi:hypothetical protein